MHSSVHPRPSEQRIVAQTRGTPSALPRGGGVRSFREGLGVEQQLGEFAEEGDVAPGDP